MISITRIGRQMQRRNTAAYWQRSFPIHAQGIVLFVVTALTLLTVLVGVLLAVLAHRRTRERRVGPPTSKPLPDAWAESGRRTEPFASPQPPPDSGEDAEDRDEED